jgi:hypothetical protein
MVEPPYHRPDQGIKHQGVDVIKISNVKIKMSNECQIPKSINNPPLPPLAKGGWGDLIFEFWI